MQLIEGIEVSLVLPRGDVYTETDGFIESCVVLSEQPAAANPIAVFLSQSPDTASSKSMAMIPH